MAPHADNYMEGIQDYMQQKAVVDINPEGHALLMIQLFWLNMLQGTHQLPVPAILQLLASDCTMQLFKQGLYLQPGTTSVTSHHHNPYCQEYNAIKSRHSLQTCHMKKGKGILVTGSEGRMTTREAASQHTRDVL
jgi:hypothetical protein